MSGLFPRGKKETLAKVLHSLGLTRVLPRASHGLLTIFNYHRIRPNDPSFHTDFDDGVFGPTQEQFESQIRWLRDNLRLLSEDELLDIVASGERPARPCAMITFDDGYLDNYTLARPVLEEYQVPAIFFIPSAAITERTLGWWDQIAYIVKRCARDQVKCQGEVLSLRNREKTIHRLLERMKIEPHFQTTRLVDELTEACGVSPPGRDVQSRELMSWEQVKECAAGRIAIGSHGHTHRVLATLSAEQQRQELAASKAEIERQVGRPVRTLAYPVGRPAHFTSATMAAARDCGYRLGLSFLGHHCYNRWSSLVPYDIRRTSGPRSLAMLAATVALPGLFTRGGRADLPE